MPMRPIRTFAALTLAALLACAGPAAAQSVAEKAKQADALAADGKFVDALATLDDAEGVVWDKMPLACRRILWVADKASGFGIYNPREGNAYGAGEAMLAYAEPVGFGWRKSGDIWHAELAADVVFRSDSGAELVKKQDFGHFPLASRVRNREFQLDLNFSLSGAPPGKYLVEIQLRDQVTGKKGSCTLPFVIR
jgi:hypothetical protein